MKGSLPPVLGNYTNKSYPSLRSYLQKELHLTATRAELLGNKTAYGGSTNSLDDFDGNSQRTRLLQGTQTLADSTRRLEDSHRIALETEDVGADILRNLQVQREGIIRTRDTVSVSACLLVIERWRFFCLCSYKRRTQVSAKPRAH